MVLARTIALGIALASVTLSESNPAAGVWRLSAEGSASGAATLPGVRNGKLRIRNEIFTGGTPGTPNSSQPATATPGLVLKVELAADGQRLILTSPGQARKSVFLRD